MVFYAHAENSKIKNYIYVESRYKSSNIGLNQTIDDQTMVFHAHAENSKIKNYIYVKSRCKSSNIGLNEILCTHRKFCQMQNVQNVCIMWKDIRNVG